MELPKEYPLAVATAIAINLQCYTAAWSVGAARKKTLQRSLYEKIVRRGTSKASRRRNCSWWLSWFRKWSLRPEALIRV